MSCKKKKKTVVIEPGCITCGACEFVAPEIFEVIDISQVKPDAQVSAHEDAIEEAIRMCPVNVIRYSKDEK